MTFRHFRVKSFDGVTLDNGSTLSAVDSVQEPGRAQLQIITLPSGQKYDSTPAANAAPIVPGTVRSEVIIEETTWAAAQSVFDTISAKLGARGTLTVEEVTSTNTYTADARMKSVRNLTPIQSLIKAGLLRIYIEFELLESFA